MLREIHARFAQDCNRQPSDARWLLMEHKHYQDPHIGRNDLQGGCVPHPPCHTDAEVEDKLKLIGQHNLCFLNLFNFQMTP